MRKRVLFIYLQPSSFVRDDLEAMGARYELRPFHFPSASARSAPGLVALWIRQFFWLLRELPRADAVFGWFADYHMFLPVMMARLFRRPVLVSLGGFDCIRMPELAYGIFTSSWRGILARLIHNNADVLLPVTPALIRQTDRFVRWPEEREDGLMVNVPALNTRIEVVPTGYDPAAWPMGPPERAPSVRTVANVDSMRTVRRKGIDLFIEAARVMPDVPFEVVGVPTEHARRIERELNPPPNLTMRGPLERTALAAVYRETSVYAQLSRAEGMPNVLCEAMLCGCIPVASRIYGNPDAVGDAGILVDSPEPEQLGAAIRRALDMGTPAREAARAQIMRHFTREERYRKLDKVLTQVIGDSAAAAG